MRPRNRTIDVRGLKIHYTEWGNRQGEPLILIHGFLDHSRSWDPFVTAMEKVSKRRMWIIAPDCRGHKTAVGSEQGATTIFLITFSTWTP